MHISLVVVKYLDYDDFLVHIRKIKGMGFVKTHRPGDTGIGKTLEDLLGIIENNIAGPDFDLYELKSARKITSSMLTLFTKAPQPKGANPLLLDAFGYKHRKKLEALEELTSKVEKSTIVSLPDSSSIQIKEKELHVTIDSLKPNSVGLKLELEGKTLYIANDKNVNVYYKEDYLEIRSKTNIDTNLYTSWLKTDALKVNWKNFGIMKHTY